MKPNRKRESPVGDKCSESESRERVIEKFQEEDKERRRNLNGRQSLFSKQEWRKFEFRQQTL